MPPHKKLPLGASKPLRLAETFIPAFNSTVLATPSTPRTQSLYQRCLLVLNRLLRVDNIPEFFDLVKSGRVEPRNGLETIDDDSQIAPPSDPMRLLWDISAFGVPLCILYNAQPGIEPLDISISLKGFQLNLENTKHIKRAAALFLTGVNRQIKSGEWDYSSELFTVSELLGKNTNGFIKVMNIIFYLIERLPESRFSPTLPPSLSLAPSQYPGLLATDPANGLALAAENQEGNYRYPVITHIQDIMNAERKYVADLETMQRYAQELIQKNILATDMVHRLFPGLSKLLDFARKFLIEMEGVVRRPWEQQRWGGLFIQHEEEFEVYQPYCANYADAVELMVAQKKNLMGLVDVMNPKSELPRLLIEPTQRIWTYQLLLQDFAKYVDKSTYPYYNELEQGIATVKRISGRTKAAQLKMLQVRVEDWKGHDLSSCGELLLAEKMTVTKDGVDRGSYIFLFERIIFVCKEASAGYVGGTKWIRKLTSGRNPAPPLVLQGRVFFTNVSRASVVKGGRSLQIWWRADEGMEYFTLHCQSEEQQKQWKTTVEWQIRNHSSRHSLERAARTPPSPEALRRRQGMLFDVSPIQPTFRLAALATRPEAHPIDEPTSPSFTFTAESQKSGPSKIIDTVLSVEDSHVSSAVDTENGLINLERGPHRLTVILSKKSSSTSSPTPLTSTVDQAQNPSTDLQNSRTTGAITISSFMSINEISQHLCQHGCQDVTERLDIDSFSAFPLSSGGFGDVYRGRFKNATQVAIKTMRLQISSTELGQKSLKYAARELYIWSKCQHPNVLPLLGLVIFRDRIGMASQWLERGSLPSYIEQNPEFDSCKMSVGIASGLTYIHSSGIVHGDLKGLNILVSDDGTAMVTDFGNAMLQDCTLNFTATTQKSSLSIRWAAPELLDERQETYSTEADIYALGMTVLETFTGKVPFFGLMDITVMSAVMFRKAIPPRPEAQIPSNSRQGNLLWSLLQRCWAQEPKDRPRSLEVEVEMRRIAHDGLTRNTTLPRYI